MDVGEGSAVPADAKGDFPGCWCCRGTRCPLLPRSSAVEAPGGHERDIIKLEVLLLSDLPCSVLRCLVSNCLTQDCSGLGVEDHELRCWVIGFKDFT